MTITRSNCCKQLSKARERQNEIQEVSVTVVAAKESTLQVAAVLSESDGIFTSKEETKNGTGSFSWLYSQLAQARALLNMAAHHSSM